MFKKDKKNWKLYLFYNGILIKKLRINENDEINGKPLCLLIVGHKEIFKKWIVRVMVTPICLLHNDEVKKITYWGVIDEKGVVVK